MYYRCVFLCPCKQPYMLQLFVTSVTSWNWEEHFINQNDTVHNPLTTFVATVDSSDGRTAAGLAFHNDTNTLWWAWRDGADLVSVYKNGVLFEAFTSPNGRLYSSYNQILYGGGGETASITRANLDTGVFDPLWTDIVQEPVEFRPVAPVDGSGLWCWRKRASDTGSGELLFFDGGINMISVHTNMWYGHIFGIRFDGAVYFLDADGNDLYGDKRGFFRPSLYANDPNTPVPEDAMLISVGNQQVDSGDQPFYWTPQRNSTSTSPAPAEGWALATRGHGPSHIFTNTQTTYFTDTSYNFIALGQNIYSGKNTEFVEITLTEESTVWLHGSGSGQDSANFAADAGYITGMTFLIDNIKYGQVPFTSHFSPMEGLSSDVISGRGSAPFTTNMEYNIHGSANLSHSITVNLQPGTYRIQARLEAVDPGHVHVFLTSQLQLMVSVVDFDPDAESVRTLAHVNGTFENVTGIARSENFVYLLGAGHEFRSWWGQSDATRTVQRHQLIGDVVTSEMQNGRDVPLPLIPVDLDFITLSGIPNDSMATDGSSLFYANGDRIRICDLTKSASSSTLYTASGEVKGLAYHPINERLYFVVVDGPTTGLWSVTTSGTGATREASMSFASNGIYSSDISGTLMESGNIHDRSAMHGQIGCTGDGAVWFNTISGVEYSMNRWSSTDGLRSVSSTVPWEIGINAIAVGTNEIVSVAAPTLFNLGNYFAQSNGAPCVYSYSFVDGGIVRDFSSGHADLRMADAYAFHCMAAADYDSVLLCCMGFSRSGDPFVSQRQMTRVWGLNAN